MLSEGVPNCGVGFGGHLFEVLDSEGVLLV